MSGINSTVKMALENTVLCRGCNGPKESYEYAAMMERVIKAEIARTLSIILESPEHIEDNLKKLISEINK